MKNQTEFFYYLPSLDLKRLEYYTMVKKIKICPFYQNGSLFANMYFYYDDILQARNQMTVPHSQSERQL